MVWFPEFCVSDIYKPFGTRRALTWSVWFGVIISYKDSVKDSVETIPSAKKSFFLFGFSIAALFWFWLMRNAQKIVRTPYCKNSNFWVEVSFLHSTVLLESASLSSVTSSSIGRAFVVLFFVGNLTSSVSLESWAGAEEFVRSENERLTFLWCSPGCNKARGQSRAGYGRRRPRKSPRRRETDRKRLGFQRLALCLGLILALCLGFCERREGSRRPGNFRRGRGRVKEVRDLIITRGGGSCHSDRRHRLERAGYWWRFWVWVRESTRTIEKRRTDHSGGLLKTCQRRRGWTAKTKNCEPHRRWAEKLERREPEALWVHRANVSFFWVFCENS